MLEGNGVLTEVCRRRGDGEFNERGWKRTKEWRCFEGAGFWDERFLTARLLVMGEDLVLRGANAPR